MDLLFRLTHHSVGRWGVHLKNVCFSVLFVRPLNVSKKRIRSHVCRTCVQMCVKYEEPRCSLAAELLERKFGRTRILQSV